MAFTSVMPNLYVADYSFTSEDEAVKLANDSPAGWRGRSGRRTSTPRGGTANATLVELFAA
jgi:hypothetical protein